MNDKDIIKALECCIGDEEGKNCVDCPLYEIDDCQLPMYQSAITLIKRQQEEIERLGSKKIVIYGCARASGKTDRLVRALQDYESVRAEAIKEFAERLKTKTTIGFCPEHRYVDAEDIDNLVKEMLGKEDE